MLIHVFYLSNNIINIFIFLILSSVAYGSKYDGRCEPTWHVGLCRTRASNKTWARTDGRWHGPDTDDML